MAELKCDEKQELELCGACHGGGRCVVCGGHGVCSTCAGSGKEITLELVDALSGDEIEPISQYYAKQLWTFDPSVTAERYTTIEKTMPLTLIHSAAIAKSELINRVRSLKPGSAYSVVLLPSGQVHFLCVDDDDAQTAHSPTNATSRSRPRSRTASPSGHA